MEYKLIPADEVPERQGYRGWANIIKDFLNSGEKYAYIQFDTKEEVKKASGGLASSGRTHHVKVSQHTHLLRVYFERL